MGDLIQPIICIIYWTLLVEVNEEEGNHGWFDFIKILKLIIEHLSSNKLNYFTLLIKYINIQTSFLECLNFISFYASF